MAFKLRRLQLTSGTTFENQNFTGLPGELTYDTETAEIHVHDGSRISGFILATNDRVDTLLQGKQNVVTDLATIRAGAAAGATALQEHQDISGKANWGTTLASYGITDAYTKEEAKAEVASQIASVVAGADEKFDTLKEIADWINSDTTGAAAMSNAISALQSADVAIRTELATEVSTLNTTITTKESDICDLISDEVEARKSAVQGVVDSLTKVATTGSYNDLEDLPTIPVIPGNATTTDAGLMSSTDKTKLNGIESGAQINVIESVKVNGTSVSIVDKEIELTIPDAQVKADWNETNISSKAYILNKPELADIALSGDYNDLKNPPLIPTIPSNATTTTSGLMSSTDKSKLNGIEAKAQVNVIDTVMINGEEVEIEDKTLELTIPGLATDTDDGYITAADKVKLDSVEEGAQANKVLSVNGAVGDVEIPVTLTQVCTFTKEEVVDAGQTVTFTLKPLASMRPVYVKIEVTSMSVEDEEAETPTYVEDGYEFRDNMTFVMRNVVMSFDADDKLSKMCFTSSKQAYLDITNDGEAHYFKINVVAYQ